MNHVNRKTPQHCRAAIVAFALFLGTLIICPRASADIGVVLEEALDNGASRFTASGHSAVYFSNICAEGPVKLRLCRDGEQGSIISAYEDFGENAKYGWNVVPLNFFMYGVADANQRPLIATEKIKNALENDYRKKFLAEYCSGPCETNVKANWRSTIGATFNRSIYIFIVRTTTEQDLEFIRTMNSLPNENHFNMFRRNCADFTKQVVNEYFPHSARANVVNDFGMTSPKAVARSFAQFAHKRPDLEFRVLHFAQLPGTYKRSDKNRLGTELTFHSKLYLAPLVTLGILSIHETLPVFISTYMLTGRFNPQREWEKHASPEATAGNSDEWAMQRANFQSFLANAAKDPSAPKISPTKHTFKNLDRAATPRVDEDGSIWMELHGENDVQRVGIAANNVLTPGSNRDLAYEIILARVNRELKSPSHSREMIPEFQNDWTLLQQARERVILSTSLSKGAPQR